MSDEPTTAEWTAGIVTAYPGWATIVTELGAGLDALGVEVVDMKQKWGELRCYVRGNTAEAEALIRDAETRSVETCEQCGEPGVLCKSTHGWHKTLCPDDAERLGYVAVRGG